ncbi:N-acetylmuramoyl-L-alanine amidase [Alistipes sp. OttesenSCG-928-B03]|nr:N-acetylmuramoyl-L-alanine amidase [Alistipes sp. OttesenSCG-928-B03]
MFLLFSGAICYGQTDGAVRTVVLDPGHGGKDPGAVFKGVYEKDINLAVALELGRMIRAEMPDVKVVYTRDKDVAVGLSERGQAANKAKADLFISIHVNAVDKGVTPPSGALTLVMGASDKNTGKNLDMAMRENNVIMYEEDYTTTYKEYMSGSSEMFIIYSLMQYVNIEQSIVFADLVQRQFKSATAMPDKGIRRQELLVLWYTTMPGVLVELGFINHDNDRKYLTSAKGQKSMATAIFNALKEYKKDVEGRSKPLQVENGTATAGTPRQGASQQGATTGSTGVTQRQGTAAPVQSAGKSSGVVYRIQIRSALKKIPKNSAELKDYRGQAHETFDGNRYRYYVGECRTFAEVTELQARVRKVFPDAFAVAFDGDRQITIPEARRRTDR